jgi:hypothetical protein
MDHFGPLSHYISYLQFPRLKHDTPIVIGDMSYLLNLPFVMFHLCFSTYIEFFLNLGNT